MKILFFSCVIFIFFISCAKKDTEEKSQSIPKETEENSKIQKIVVAYVAGWKKTIISTIQAEKLTHINYAFANIIDGKVAFGTEKDTIDNAVLNKQDLIELQKLKAKNPNLKILVSVGGWTWSGNFSDAALNDSSRKKFAKSAADFVKKYKLDGIDIDWEYPNQIGAGNIHRPADVENFTLLLREVRIELNKLSKNNEHFLLTIATGGDSAYITNTHLGEAAEYLDFINIMTYDFYNGLHKITGHHANLYPVKNDPANSVKHEDVRSLVSAVKNHINSGVPKEKIVVGIPFYGRIWTGVEKKSNNGLFANAESVGKIITYDEIKNKFLSNSEFTYFFDSLAKAPFLYSASQSNFISYENTASLTEKLNYIEENELRGVMFWEYSKDKNGDLLNLIYNRVLNVHKN